MKPEIIDAAIAGLLHDIGKLEQRAQMDPWVAAPGVDREGQPVHATWTTYFIQHYIPQTYRRAVFAGAYHHAPEKSPAQDKNLSELIALADKLSAGERADPEDENKSKDPPPRQMVTIFDRITLKDQTKQNGWHYLPLQEIKLNKKAIFPTEKLSPNQEIDAYENLCKNLRNIAQQDIPDPQTYLENLQGALQRITWCVPSAYYHSVPDVSLYDHSRMTAAVAVCLVEKDPTHIRQLLDAVQHDFRKVAEPNDKALLETPVALLIGGDISGVQNFIYTISSKGAAKMLRGRSFYLQLLTEVVLRFVLDKLELPAVNVIYTGGGHFYLLAPLSAASKLPEIRKQISEILLAHHGTSLYLALGCAEVPASGFRLGEFPKYWGMMHTDLENAKQKRYTEFDDKFYERIFEPPKFGGNPEAICSICGEDNRTVTIWKEEQDEESPVRICSLCRSFAEELGSPLTSANFVLLGYKKPDQIKPGTARTALQSFGWSFQFLKNASEPVNNDAGYERAIIWAINDPSDDRWPDLGKIPTARLLRYTANRVPPMSFDELKEKVKGGFKRLGVLRMDMDNLGELFKSGLGEKATLARMSTLSLQVSLFFEGWVKYLCETGDYQDLIYTVYTGGDDVFLIGPWDLIPHLAQKITAALGEFTAHHPALHASAGMAFIGGKYPVYQAADDARDALELAKQLEGKNAFGFLGQPWPWNVFNQVAEKHERLLKITGSTRADSLEGPQAILHLLRQFAAEKNYLVQRKRTRLVWGPWMWRGAYMLTRMAERVGKKQPQLSQELIAIHNELDKNNYEEIDQWGCAARWTQLETRTDEQR